MLKNWYREFVKMCSAGRYCMECIKYQKIVYSPMKKDGFVPENGSEVFVRNIPVDERESDLLTFFESAGDIFQLRLMMNENGKENRGFAYVTYINPTSAKKAVCLLNELPYKGKYYLRIEHSLNNCRLFIGGIPTFKTKDQVWQELYKNGVKNIMDVIMYRSYTDRAQNRGFVFVEFKTHEEAAYFRAKYGKSLRLWNNSVIVDWSVPVPQIDESVMERVKILYLRNLDVSERPELLQETILQFIPKRHLEKLFKFKNYAFVHLPTREIAETLLTCLIEHYKDTPVEVTWAKPPNKYTTQEYRQKKVSSLSVRASPPKSNRLPSPVTMQSCSSMISGNEYIMSYNSRGGLQPPDSLYINCQSTGTCQQPSIMSPTQSTIGEEKSKFQVLRRCFSDCHLISPSSENGTHLSDSLQSLSSGYLTPNSLDPSIRYFTNALSIQLPSTPDELVPKQCLSKCLSPNFVYSASPLMTPIASANEYISPLLSTQILDYDPIAVYQQKMKAVYGESMEVKRLTSDSFPRFEDVKIMPRNIKFGDLQIHTRFSNNHSLGNVICEAERNLKRIIGDILE